MSRLYGDKQYINSDTVKDFFSKRVSKDSEGLESDYSVSYRIESEYVDFFEKLNCSEIGTGKIFEGLINYSETGHMCFLGE